MVKENTIEGAICKVCGERIEHEAYLIGGELYHNKCVDKKVLGSYTAKEKKLGRILYMGLNG
jgi:hypothetical protein